MKTIFEALRESHDKQRRLLAALSDTHGDTDKREGLFAAVKAELVHHENAEERYFYNPLMEHDMTQEKARHSVAEHHEIDELVEELEATDYSSPAWLNSAKKLEHLVTHHLDEEEQEVFQIAGRVLGDDEKTQLAHDYDQMMEEQASGSP
ncbi:hemerythrin domain-containing protein [Salinisphaera hydrothermalis]|uniref:Hemerythrin HHE cation binding protein n=1 Tax=Salinisphaera hydrothermalis (strain C41B8) TaxID=1304275 RepID=A0A084IJL7_SALHC|nr:hemerythrin domain-containing protein [Salinisphaera hydrothermalis]KEZ76901.1 hemerythrin HHE cation binding protein [Salinisphaera hydrothermalis C41B8]